MMGWLHTTKAEGRNTDRMKAARPIIHAWLYPLLLGLLFAPFVLKYFLATVSMGRGESSLQIILAILSHDAGVYLGILLLLALANLVFVPRLLVILLRLLALLIYTVFLLDVLTARLFFLRLTLEDLAKFVREVPVYLVNFVTQLISGWSLLLCLVVGLLLVWAARRSPLLRGIFHRHYRLGHWNGRFHLGFMAALLALVLWLPAPSHVHGWFYQNIFQYLYVVSGQLRPYSAGFAAELKSNAGHGAVPHCEQIPTRQKDVLLVLVESWSMKHSGFFSDFGHATPFLDQLARDNTSYTQFFANGFTTEDGLISILGGVPPISPPGLFAVGGNSSFKGFEQLDNSLPALFAAAGYETEFITSGNLAFIGKRKWLKDLGYAYTEGHEHSAYEGHREFIFNSSADELLLDRALQRLGPERDAGRPLFLTVETVSSHTPFKHPVLNDHSEAAVMRYVDEQLGRFYQQLEASGFFTNGILLLVSDHRSMTPLEPLELDRFGLERGPALVPMIWVDAEHQSRNITQPFQQIDIAPSFRGLISGRACYSEWFGNFLLPEPRSARFILHRRGDRRDMVSVFSAEGDSRIRLNGDKTAFSGATALTPQDQRKLLEHLNTLRTLPD